MEHFLDISAIGVIIAIAGFYLYRTFSKARKGCGSICSGCSGSCATTVKKFNSPTESKVINVVSRG
ncbi:MAG TPA: FeoB-associated Cys-rich membrane protein [Burkholderiales bacterium]|jgi:hypothetical protein|nr:FeoB-associated Cys-rich membrane protein [Burkholderiales bacterium]